MNIPSIESLNTGAKRGELYIRKQFPEFYKSLPKDGRKFPEILYTYYYGSALKCPVCGRRTTFLSFSKGYSTYCSSKCANSDPAKKQKVERTCIERYGCKASSQSDKVKEKAKQTCIERYGVPTPFENADIQKQCAKHDTAIEKFIQEILDNHSIKYIREDQMIIPGMRVDFHIPDKKLVIEANGTYWHSDKCKSPRHHIQRFIRTRNAGFRSLTIWEDQIIRSPKIVESVLLSKLGIYKRKLGARQCTIRKIDSKACNNFLNDNHIQGATSSKIKLGAFVNDELVGVMTFIQSRGCQGSKHHATDQWELNRFCTLLYTQVIGLASKFLKYFITQYSPASIISFSHNDISDGNVYSKLGFKPIGNICSSYYYIKSNKRYHRSNFTRAGIVRKWPEYDINDKSWTERQVMNDKKYFRIYDCGTQKWLLTL